ncbi:YggS family pyridoxal phosphate-dependent enzyme [Virgisporangium ochraceum]|uniref:Pyridoxal phosphate homeostasis protein n=1 Tax=Virgisporangium ochraceum TaxID=65505 RepID=A0A8J4EE36_9ACTN|nr:YggS family pyridoxal phosphate-dependent enzyme [Virgisporangium ochraceum]GIJ68622.1 YggS family pyridoxal phosphate enzyme [Virgisporangium ochraceum]
MSSRQEQLALNLSEQRERLAAACAAAGRSASEVTIIAVTKTYPVADVLALAALGVTDIGENRDQEAAAKAAATADAGVEVRWHFVGQLQRNKCRSVVTYADMVHSVDSVPLARALAGAADRHRERPLDVLVQVSIDGDAARGGAIEGAADPEREVRAVVDEIAGSPALRLRGVMAVAPVRWEPAEAFAKLGEVAEWIRADHPDATVVSAGMSADLEQAVNAGATHVRLGGAILGNRLPPAVA